MFPFSFQACSIQTNPGYHVGGGNFVSHVDEKLQAICTADRVYKLRLNINPDQYAEHFLTINEWLSESIRHTAFMPFEDKPEMLAPLIHSYKFYYGIGTQEHPRLHLDKFEGQAQFTLWLPSPLLHDLSSLEDRIQFWEEELKKSRLKKFQSKTEKEIKIADSSLQLRQKRLNECLVLKACYLEAHSSQIHLLYWESLASWIKKFSADLEERGILYGGIDNADLPLSPFFSLRRMTFSCHFRETEYVPYTETDKIEMLKKILFEDPVYNLLLNKIDGNRNSEHKLKISI